MKRKNQNLFLCMVLLTSFFLSSCDMIRIDNSRNNPPETGGRVITEDERKELEKNERYLKLINLPLHVQTTNVYSASVMNSSSVVGRLDKNKTALIYRETDSCTVYLPLTGNDGAEFLETGFFYSSFSVHVDALTKFIVEPSDLFVVQFTDGRGQADVNNLPSSPANAANRPFLTVYNLPSSVSIYNFSDVFVHNQTGPVAGCVDFSQIALSVSDNRASAKIPLQYISLNQIFSETGVFYVSLDVNIDVETRYTLSPDDKVKVTFINGNGYLDVQNIPDSPAPYLTVKGLPTNAAGHHVSKVSVYNSAAPVAVCRDYKLVSVFKDADSSSFLIPLSSVSDGSFFQDSGKFLVSFEINVDIDVQIVFSRSDGLTLQFTNGSAEIDLKKYVKTYSDDFSPNPISGIELSETDKDRLEKTGHYLKLVNMPENTQAPNFFSLSVANSSSPIAKLNNSAISIYRENDSCTVYLPLVYNDNNDFIETGAFYVSFVIHVDAVTKYVLDSSDKFLVYFIYGRGLADVNDLNSDSSIIPQITDNELNETQRDDLEKTGHYLKFVNLPANTLAPNFFSASVSNSSSSVAKFGNSGIFIYRENDSCTAYLPLVYNDNNDFLETGAFYVSFIIHVDAVTKYVVDSSDKFLVYFVQGRGQADVKNIPSKSVITEEPRYLTVSNLPPSASVNSFKGASVLTQAGTVAVGDCTLTVLSSVNGKITAKIPLRNNSINQNFIETGAFYVSFDIIVDVDNRYTVTPDDKVKISFVNGNGFIDVKNIPSKPVPYLAIKGLPLNASKHHITNVNVYNLAGSVASCSDHNNILTDKENNLLTFLVPLSSSNGGYFLDSGRFAVSFTVNVDIDTKIEYAQKDNLILQFTDGSAVFDVNSFFGFFNAELFNPFDNNVPVIRSGSSFDVNGKRCTVNGNLTVQAPSPNSSCVLFLYVFYLDGEFIYEFSVTVPSYNSSRRGWYNGSKRALWKMIYLNNTNPPMYLFKTVIADDFPHLNKFTLTYNNDYSQLTAQKPVSKSINGSSDPPPETFTLNPGVYVVELKGAGGGGGTTYYGKSNGGNGGKIMEILTLNSPTTFTAFTGSGGKDASSVSTSGVFNIVTKKNYYTYTFSFSHIYDPIYHASSAFIDTVTVSCPSGTNIYGGMYGGGGGGGGSGSFLYSPDAKYLLVAGGGGGGSGSSFLTPGGAGGAGGSFGPGAAGGFSGSMFESSSDGPGDYYSVPSSIGGAGGGFNGGVAGGSGINAEAFIFSNSWQSGGANAASYSSSDLSIPDGSIPYLYISTTYAHENTYSFVLVTEQSAHKIITVCTSFTFSGDSGKGGDAAAISYPSGHENDWLNTLNVAGNGANSPSLPFISWSGTIKPDGTGDTVNTAPITYSSSYAGSGPGTYRSTWNTSDPSFTKITLTLLATSGKDGSSGGNNRNSTRSNGSPSRTAGSVTIHKIY